MRAAVVLAPGRLQCRDVPAPRPGLGEVLVRTRRASICGSDVHVIYDGFSHHELPGPPGYPGHEGVGVVLELGPGAGGVEAGCPVLTVPSPPDAMCFSEVQRIRATSLIALPGGADLDRMLMAQQLGTVLYAARKFLAGLEARGTAVVIGAGSAGLFFLQALRRAGFRRVAVSDLEPHRLDTARRLGATLTVRAPRESIREAVLDLTGGAGADLVVEAAGWDSTRAEAVECTAVGGRLGLFGFPQRPGLAPFPFEAAFRRSLTIQTSVGTQQEPGLRSFREAVEAIAKGDFEVDHLLAPVYPIERIQEAVEAARHRQGGKVSLTFEEA